MAQKITYWITTVIVAGLSLVAARACLSGDAHMVTEFTHLGSARSEP